MNKTKHEEKTIEKQEGISVLNDQKRKRNLICFSLFGFIEGSEGNINEND